jgi:hypothetical protein
VLYSVDRLFDYVVGVLGGALYAQPMMARLWSETQEALHRAEGRSALDVRVVKVIGLLHILSEQTRLFPSRDAIRFALAEVPGDVNRGAVDAAISGLEAATLITYRPFKKAFRPYAGSEIDIEERQSKRRVSSMLSRGKLWYLHA